MKSASVEKSGLLRIRINEEGWTLKIGLWDRVEGLVTEIRLDKDEVRELRKELLKLRRRA